MTSCNVLKLDEVQCKNYVTAYTIMRKRWKERDLWNNPHCISSIGFTMLKDITFIFICALKNKKKGGRALF